ncbi:MAG: RNA polymerase factor sigma-54 [Thiohalospira sp.]
MLKQSLQQKLLQKLSPQQIQMIKLLEIPTIQLEQRIKKELEENPVLEEGKDDEELKNDVDEDISEDNLENDPDEFSLEDYINDEDIPSYKLASHNYSKDDKKEEIPFSVGTSFHEYLQHQIGLRNLSEKEEVLALYLIGNIDDDGYVRRKIEAIVNDLAFSQNIETNEDELLEVLKIVQDLEPTGVGARSLQECLLLQIESKNQEIPEIALARKILKYYFQEFTKKHYEKIITRLNISEEELKNAINEILKLNPKPGSSYSESQSQAIQTIVPDFILDNKDGELQLSLNARNVPELKLNSTYTEMLEGYALKSKDQKTKNDKEAISFVKQKLDSAKWFIDAIKQRQNTLLLTMNAIIEYQYNYFLEGDESKLKPMILKDIAERTGLDISTISRVANSKYVQTNFGIFPLKYFFSEGLQTESGEEVSSREIKSILKECIANEEKKKPLTDDKLTNILKEKGYRIARRTVAKYREQLNIPVARLRKEL